MNSRLRHRLCAPVVLIALVVGCSAGDGDEELDEATSAHRKHQDCKKDDRYDVKPLGVHEVRVLHEYGKEGWSYEKGGMAKKNGRTVMGVPGPNQSWLFCVEEGGKRTYRVVGADGLGTRDVEVELVTSTLAPQHNRSCKYDACKKARDHERRCGGERKKYSYEPACALTYGFAWAEADVDADQTCSGC